ncbi:helix-turn-helix domain-containing protein [Paenibacillus larvae]
MSGKKHVQIDYDVISDTAIFNSVYEKMVYVILCKYANWTTKSSYPSVARIAKEAFCSENTVRKALRKLTEIGLISAEERRNEQGGQTSNLYILLKVPDTFRGGSPDAPGPFTV